MVQPDPHESVVLPHLHGVPEAHLSDRESEAIRLAPVVAASMLSHHESSPPEVSRGGALEALFP